MNGQPQPHTLPKIDLNPVEKSIAIYFFLVFKATERILSLCSKQKAHCNYGQEGYIVLYLLKNLSYKSGTTFSNAIPRDPFTKIKASEMRFFCKKRLSTSGF